MMIIRLFLLVLVLSACSTLPSIPPLETSHVDSWTLNAGMTISTEHDRWTARVYWKQEESSYTLRFHSPMGQGALVLTGNKNGVTLRTSDKKIFKADNPDTLIFKVLKLDIPVTNLQYWIRGLPAPNSAPQDYNLDKSKRLSRLQQDDWEIDYRSYMNVNGTFLPRKIFLENNQFKIKIIISLWKI
ncbi:MAG: outer membrane lipoprotein LolB [Thiomargarita sp.]|nr:outer membrane lipoprotein LolB [Thiomargarita sp.]